MEGLKDSILRHVVQSAIMGLPAFRALARRWHNTGMVRSKEKILPVLRMILSMLHEVNEDIENRVVMELGPVRLRICFSLHYSMGHAEPWELM